MASKPRRRGYDDGGVVNQDPGPVKSASTGQRISDAIRGGMMINQLAKVAGGGLGGAQGAAGAAGASGAMGGNFTMARGGRIKATAGPRIGKDDGLIPAQKGEYVVRRSAVKKLGTPALNQINRGKLPARKGR